MKLLHNRNSGDFWGGGEDVMDKIDAMNFQSAYNRHT